MASELEDVPWLAAEDKLIDYTQRPGAPIEVTEDLEEVENEGKEYKAVEDIQLDYPSKEDFFFNEEEYQFATIAPDS